MQKNITKDLIYYNGKKKYNNLPGKIKNTKLNNE